MQENMIKNAGTSFMYWVSLATPQIDKFYGRVRWGRTITVVSRGDCVAING